MNVPFAGPCNLIAEIVYSEHEG